MLVNMIDIRGTDCFHPKEALESALDLEEWTTRLDSTLPHWRFMRQIVEWDLKHFQHALNYMMYSSILDHWKMIY